MVLIFSKREEGVFRWQTTQSTKSSETSSSTPQEREAGGVECRSSQVCFNRKHLVTEEQRKETRRVHNICSTVVITSLLCSLKKQEASAWVGPGGRCKADQGLSTCQEPVGHHSFMLMPLFLPQFPLPDRWRSRERELRIVFPEHC